MNGEKTGVRGSHNDYWERNMEEQKGESKHWFRVRTVTSGRMLSGRMLKGTPGLVLNICCP